MLEPSLYALVYRVFYGSATIFCAEVQLLSRNSNLRSLASSCLTLYFIFGKRTFSFYQVHFKISSVKTFFSSKLSNLYSPVWILFKTEIMLINVNQKVYSQWNQMKIRSDGRASWNKHIHLELDFSFSSDLRDCAERQQSLIWRSIQWYHLAE